MQFTVQHHGQDKLGLVALLQRYADDQWVGKHYSERQAAEAVMDRFQRALRAELEMIEVRAQQTPPA